MPSINKTGHLKLHKWQENEHVDFLEIAEDNQKVDDAIRRLDENGMSEAEVLAIIQKMNMDARFDAKVDKLEGHSLISTAEKDTIARLDQKEEAWEEKLVQLEQRADTQWSLIKGADYVSNRTEQGIWITVATKNGIKVAERLEHPKNAQGKYITLIKIFSSSGQVLAQSTITEWKDEQTGKYHEEVR